MCIVYVYPMCVCVQSLIWVSHLYIPYVHPMCVCVYSLAHMYCHSFEYPIYGWHMCIPYVYPMSVSHLCVCTVTHISIPFVHPICASHVFTSCVCVYSHLFEYPICTSHMFIPCVCVCIVSCVCMSHAHTRTTRALSSASLLQSVAVCCSVLQSVAVLHHKWNAHTMMRGTQSLRVTGLIHCAYALSPRKARLCVWDAHHAHTNESYLRLIVCTCLKHTHEPSCTCERDYGIRDSFYQLCPRHIV